MMGSMRTRVTNRRRVQKESGSKKIGKSPPGSRIERTSNKKQQWRRMNKENNVRLQRTVVYKIRSKYKLYYNSVMQLSNS